MSEFGELKHYEWREVEQLDVDWDEGPIELQRHFHALGYRKLPKGISSIQMGRTIALITLATPNIKVDLSQILPQNY